MREWWRSLGATYLSVDPRSLGLFRVLFGLVLLSDLGRRWVELGKAIVGKHAPDLGPVKHVDRASIHHRH